MAIAVGGGTTAGATEPRAVSTAEGDSAPLARLEEVRKDPQKSADRAAIESLERDLSSFPSGRVRAEALLVVAQAWRQKLGEPRRAIGPLEAVVADNSADRLTRALALSELSALRRELGEIDAALVVLERYPDLAPGTRKEIRSLVQRERLRIAAIGVLSLLVSVGLGSLVFAARRLGGVREVQGAVVRPLAIAFAFYVGGAAALLVRIHGEGDPRPFVWLGLGIAAVDVIARTWRLASGTRSVVARTTRALACALGVLAVAFLAIERTDAGYLENFGL